MAVLIVIPPGSLPGGSIELPGAEFCGGLEGGVTEVLSCPLRIQRFPPGARTAVLLSSTNSGVAFPSVSLLLLLHSIYLFYLFHYGGSEGGDTICIRQRRRLTLDRCDLPSEVRNGGGNGLSRSECRGVSLEVSGIRAGEIHVYVKE